MTSSVFQIVIWHLFGVQSDNEHAPTLLMWLETILSLRFPVNSLAKKMDGPGSLPPDAAEEVL